ncbi:MAG: class I SAM-dependent methyltransferase [bacterium]
MKDNRAYYDDFSGWYERERHHGYHALLDQLQVGIARPLSASRDVLEVGCGTGMILKEIAPVARHAVGIDISRGMLGQAQERGLHVVEGSATALPFADASFDFVYSFKCPGPCRGHPPGPRGGQPGPAPGRPGGPRVLQPALAALPHQAPQRSPTRSATRPPTTRSSPATTACLDVRSYLPPGLALEDVRRVRVLTPFAQAHRVPLVSTALAWAEHQARDKP